MKLTLAEVYLITDSRLLPIKSSTEQSPLRSSFRRTCARTVRGHAPSSSTRKRIFANKQDKTAFFFFRTFLQDAVGLHKGSYAVSMKILLIFRCIAATCSCYKPHNSTQCFPSKKLNISAIFCRTGYII